MSDRLVVATEEPGPLCEKPFPPALFLGVIRHLAGASPLTQILFSMSLPHSIQELSELLAEQKYLADQGLATALFLALQMGRPLLLEGSPGVGKTEVAKALAGAFGKRLIRLQCYEGIDVSQALYEWDFARQMVAIRAEEITAAGPVSISDQLFSRRFLVERPLLAALQAGSSAVLLIDEIDRADDEFEAFLLEFLAEFQITIPELGTISADTPPAVVLTSNRTREMHDALKRRCFYHWIDYPTQSREKEIILLRAPEVEALLAEKVVATVARMRELALLKKPGIAESIDWASGLQRLQIRDLEDAAVQQTLGLVLKEHDDLMQIVKEKVVGG
jgi:MoxR-like ATPase